MSFDAELRCILCRRPLRGQDNVMLRALGRQLGPAHRACTDLVHAGARVAGVAAVGFGQKWLQSRAPKLFAGLELYKSVNKRMQAELDRRTRDRDGAPSPARPHVVQARTATTQPRLLPRRNVKRVSRTQ